MVPMMNCSIQMAGKLQMPILELKLEQRIQKAVAVQMETSERLPLILEIGMTAELQMPTLAGCQGTDWIQRLDFGTVLLKNIKLIMTLWHCVGCCSLGVV